MTSLIFFLSLAHAQSAFEQAMSHDTGTKSEESWVAIKNHRFRKFEMANGLYYLKFKDGDTKTAQIYCVPPEGYKTESLIIEQPRKESRSPAFVGAFHEACKNAKGNTPVTITLDPKIGLTYPEAKKQDDDR